MKLTGVMCLVSGMFLAACGPGASGGPGEEPGGEGPGGGEGGGVGTGDPTADYVVYAHSEDTLYKIDSDSLAVTLVAPFTFDGPSDDITDIAIDAEGRVIGISFDTVYAVDAQTAACRTLAPLAGRYNGLSFIASEGVEGDREILVGADLTGAFVQIDPMTGASTMIGTYGNDTKSSGDIVSVTGLGTLATVTQPALANDFLARIDASTGEATIIGDTGVTDLWGLAYWDDAVYGFSSDHNFYKINSATGAATLIETDVDILWWGAGVTTSAPVID